MLILVDIYIVCTFHEINRNFIQLDLIHYIASYHNCLLQEFQWLEFFAGVGNLTKMMKSTKYRGMRFDLEDNARPSHRRSNFMDLLHSSGWGNLALVHDSETVSYFEFSLSGVFLERV